MTTKLERWLPVPGWERCYEVSDNGRIRGLLNSHGTPNKAPRPRAIHKNKDGYNFVVLYDRARRQGFTVGRLVLRAFRPTSAPLMECSHIDGDCTNDSLDNLCWETRQQNEDRKKVHGTRPHGEINTAAILRERDIPKIVAMWRRGRTQDEIGETLGVSRVAIGAVVRGKTWRHVTKDMDMAISPDIAAMKERRRLARGIRPELSCT